MFHNFRALPNAVEAGVALCAAIDASLGSDPARLTVGLDQMIALDAGSLRTLLQGLKRARAAGAQLQLYVTRADLRHTLAVTGLEKVFDVIDRLPNAA